MIPLSNRHVAALIALLLLALAPVAVNSYAGRQSDTCADAVALEALPTPAGGSSWKDSRDLHGSGVFLWKEAEADAEDEGRDALRFRMVRSVNPLEMTLMPHAYVGAQNQFYTHDVVWIDSEGGRIPVHTRRAETSGMIRTMAYLFVVDGRPVVEPMRAAAEGILERLLQGPRPGTLYWASGSSLPAAGPEMERRASEWVEEAWQRHRHVCGV